MIEVVAPPVLVAAGVAYVRRDSTFARSARLAALAGAALLLAVGCGGSGDGGKLPLQTVDDVPLPGSNSRFDYQRIDPERNLLILAHLGNDSVVLFDIKRRRVVHEVPGISHVKGISAAPELGLAFASANGTNEVVGIDEDSGRVVWRASTGASPDGVAYDPGSRRVFVSDQVGGTLTVVGAAKGRPIGAVDLGTEVGNVQRDPGSGKILANAQGTGELVTVAPQSLAVERRMPLPGCTANHGLLIDAPIRRAFVACEDNSRLLVVDLKAMKILQDLPTGERPDVLALDPSLHRLYVAAESGIVSVYDERGGKLAKAGQARLDPAAHSVAVDPRTHLVHFPLQDVGGKPVLRIMRPTP